LEKIQTFAGEAPVTRPLEAPHPGLD